MIITYDRVVERRSPAARHDFAVRQGLPVGHADFRISGVAALEADDPRAAYFGGYGNEQDGAA